MANIRYDQKVENMVGPDPSRIPDAVAITGLIGRGAQPGSVRVYTSPDLHSYVELSEADVLYSEPMATEGSTLYVRIGAPLHYAVITSAQAQSSFLQGPLSSEYMHEAMEMAGMAGGMQSAGQAMAPTQTGACTQCCVSRSGLCTAGCGNAYLAGTGTACCVSRSGLCTAGCGNAFVGMGTGTACCVSRSGLCTAGCGNAFVGAGTGTACCVSRSGLCTAGCG